MLKGRDALAKVNDELPLQISNLSNARLDESKALIDRVAEQDPDLFIHALLTVMSRLTAPWQMVRLATKAAGSAGAARVAETRYAIVVTIVLAELERQVAELTADLHSRRGVAVGALLKTIHDGVRGLRTELDLPPDNVWARTIASQRALVADTLRFEIENVPDRVRRMLRVRKAEDIRPNSALDPDDVAETEAMLKFIRDCRFFAGELAVNEVTRRTLSELADLLQRGTRALAESLRHAGDNDRDFRQSQLDAAVRFCAQVLEPDLAADLARVAKAARLPAQEAARA